MKYTLMSIAPLLIFLIVYYLFWLFNTHYLPVKSVVVTIDNKTHTDAHEYSKTVINSYGSTMIPTQEETEVPEMSALYAQIEGQEMPIMVQSSIYNSVNIGDKVTVTYSIRRFTRSIQVVNVSK